MAGIQRSKTTSVAITLAETASVAPEVWSSSFRVSQNLITVPLTASMLTFGEGTPSIPANCPSATWIPTPVRKPISTVREMKSARNPSRATRASNNRAPQMIALRPARATHSGDSGWTPAMPSAAMPANMIAAVAESPPTTR